MDVLFPIGQSNTSKMLYITIDDSAALGVDCTCMLEYQDHINTSYRY